MTYGQEKIDCKNKDGQYGLVTDHKRPLITTCGSFGAFTSCSGRSDPSQCQVLY